MSKREQNIQWLASALKERDQMAMFYPSQIQDAVEEALSKLDYQEMAKRMYDSQLDELIIQSCRIKLLEK